MVQRHFAYGIRTSCISKMFGVSNAKVRFRIFAETTKCAGLNYTAADGKFAGSKLLRRIGVEGIQRIRGSTLTDQNL